ncbi:GGDEF domain-containing response regulator [Hydrogenimonas thermophila]|uniref:diguanylate cyclase n=1 Tax=Hydrogenimonas thermophila TaxID=223786 RepID=A0A1I5R8I5_9BACT|nr:diguanylate cyclase [Hydrogenimonas thermophila]SFP54306.1 response regulator receiver modulated diguanylate cyclase [Hydrogenimonas thermophila]
MKVKPSDSLKEISLLYVEDDESIRDILSMILQRFVGKLYIAFDGEDGLEKFKRYHPDIVISDIRMPKLNGIDMAKQMKEINPDTAIIFITAFGDSEYLNSAINLGVQGYLIKPIERDKLIEKLNFIADAIVNAKRKISYLKLINTLFDLQKDIIMLVDSNGRIQISNRAFKYLCKQLECKEDESLYELINHFNDFNQSLKDSNSIKDYLSNINGKIVSLKSNNQTLYYEMHIKSIDEFILVEMYDVSQFKKEAIKLEQENIIDALTNVYNRKVEKIIKDEVINLDSSICMIIADIDHFKEVNDTHGHIIGDNVLKEVANRLKSHIRQDDHIIRWGGEEFLLILKTKIDNADNLAEKLRKVIESEPFESVGKVTMSFGICCGYIDSVNDFDNILHRADKALYNAKMSGRNQVKRCK